jgi:hypothetical protein
MFKVQLIFCLLLTGSISLLAQPSAPQEMIDEFFEIYESGKPVEAINALYSSSGKWSEMIRADIENVRNRFKDLEQIVGEYYGKEKLVEEDLGSCLKMVIYLVRYDRQPIRFSFQYYKPNDVWQLYGFSYDDNLMEDFKQMVRGKLE